MAVRASGVPFGTMISGAAPAIFSSAQPLEPSHPDGRLRARRTTPRTPRLPHDLWPIFMKSPMMNVYFILV
jgi:hypothetical protein